MKGSEERSVLMAAIWLGFLYLFVIVPIWNYVPECNETAMVVCDPYEEYCVNRTATREVGAYWNKHTEEYTVYEKELCISWENGTKLKRHEYELSGNR